MMGAALKPVKVLLTSDVDKKILDVVRESFNTISREAELDRSVHALCT